MVEQDSLHGKSGGAEKMLTVGVGAFLSGRQSEPGFVDERGGLQGVIAALRTHDAAGDGTQMVVDKFEKPGIDVAR